MKNEWIFLCAALLLLGAITAFMLYRRFSKGKKPRPDKEMLWREYLRSVERNAALEEVYKKLQRNYVKPGGLRSECLRFVQNMRSEETLSDFSAIRTRLINTSLYPLHSEMLRIKEEVQKAKQGNYAVPQETLLARMREQPLPPACPPAPKSALYDDLLAVFTSSDVLSLVSCLEAAPEACRPALEAVMQDVCRLVERYGARL